MFSGNESNPRIPELNLIKPERIYMRFTQKDMPDIIMFANMLDITPSKVVAIFLDMGMRHTEIIEWLFKHRNNRGSLDNEIKSEVKKLMKFVNHRNPYKVHWSDEFIRLIEGPRKPRIKKLTEKMIDRETYKWNFD